MRHANIKDDDPINYQPFLNTKLIHNQIKNISKLYNFKINKPVKNKNFIQIQSISSKPSNNFQNHTLPHSNLNKVIVLQKRIPFIHKNLKLINLQQNFSNLQIKNKLKSIKTQGIYNDTPDCNKMFMSVKNKLRSQTKCYKNNIKLSNFWRIKELNDEFDIQKADLLNKSKSKMKKTAYMTVAQKLKDKYDQKQFMKKLKKNDENQWQDQKSTKLIQKTFYPRYKQIPMIEFVYGQQVKPPVIITQYQQKKINPLFNRIRINTIN